ncbi:MAG: FMN-binding protein [Candidatus Bipolaricaulia bacterium]
MKLIDRTGLKMIWVMTGIAVAAALVLAIAATVTEPTIKAAGARRLRQNIMAVLDIAFDEDDFDQQLETFNRYVTEETVDDFTYWIGRDESGEIIGYVIRPQGGGFQGIVDMAIGVEPDLGTLTGMEVVETGETPGLGQRMEEAEFRAQFNGLQVKWEDPQHVDFIRFADPTAPNIYRAITGATFTSTAIRRLLNAELDRLREILAQ